MNSSRFLNLSNDWDIAGIQSNPAFAPSFHLRINSEGLLFVEETQSLCSFIFDQRQEDVEIGKSSLFQLGYWSLAFRTQLQQPRSSCSSFALSISNLASSDRTETSKSSYEIIVFLIHARTAVLLLSRSSCIFFLFCLLEAFHNSTKAFAEGVCEVWYLHRLTSIADTHYDFAQQSYSDDIKK